jgi:PPOX class probable F420-dependent enzyme
MADSTPLDQERYISLETLRKDGTGVKTPVWAAALDGRLVIVTDGTSFKVKRLRNNPKVKVAACDARGTVKGAWYDGQGRVIEDPAHQARAIAALRRKYGWQIRVLDFFSWISRRIKRRAFLELDVAG